MVYDNQSSHLLNSGLLAEIRHSLQQPCDYSNAK